MHELKILIRPALSLFLALSLIMGLAYPLAVTGLAQTFFPALANGSLVLRNGAPVGSAILGQSFSTQGYFWGRPSATATIPYNGMASGASNQGPLNPALVTAVQSRVNALHAADPENYLPIPVDLVTASGSGLDPHISPAAAMYQVNRIARTRNLSQNMVQRLIQQNTEDDLLNLLGSPRVHVLSLNLALDALH
ncbi:K(+) transporting P-type ATPase subunit KdpC [Gammaproteobacteria bacterium]